MSSVRPVEAMVAGLNIVDVLVRLPQNMQRGEKHEVQDLLIQGGAPAGNAACILASLGWRTGFIARMGRDAMSCIARSELTRHGVLEDFLIRDDSATPGVSVVEIEPFTGERTVLYSLKGYRSLTREDIPVSDVKLAKLVLVDGYETEAALTMLEAIQGGECHSVIDIEAGDPQTLRRLIEMGTQIILPLAAAQKLSGKLEIVEALRELSTWTTGQVIATDGVNGSWAYTREGIYHQPAFKVEALDTTGCGDAYHGAYASALLDELPLALRMEFASWIAAQVALTLGGRSNLPTRTSLKNANLTVLSHELRRHVES